MARPIIPIEPSGPGGGTPGGGTGGKGNPGGNANVIQNTFQVASGLYDTVATQYPIQFSPGTVGRLYRYIGPLVLITDTFSGALELLYADGTISPTQTVSFTHATLATIATDINTAFGTYANAYVVQLGQNGYLVIESTSTYTSPTGANDHYLTLANVAISDDDDPYLAFQFVPFSTNSLGLQSTDTYGWAVGVRDIATGHISNMSPVTNISTLLYPSEANLTIIAPVHYESQGQVLEVYRTAVGGSFLFFLGYAKWSIGNVYTFRDTYNDSFLNNQLVGPISESNDPPPIGISGLVSHQGRIWGFVNNKLYYSGGPDTTNGDGNQAWPPANYFQFPGNIILAMPNPSGMLVFLEDDVHIVLGVDTTSFYPKLFLSGFGISNPKAALQDGQTLYVYTTKQQLHALSPNAQDEIGYKVGDILAASFPAASTSLTLHRGSSLDYALYVSNGSNTVLRYSPQQKAWSPKAQPLMGAGRIRSLETAIGVNTLLLTSPSASNVYSRNLSVFQDAGTSFSCFGVIGVMQIAEPGTVTSIEHIAMQFMGVGSLPTVSVLPQEISGTFTQLYFPTTDPPQLPASNTLWSYRWYLKNTETPLTQWMNTIQIKVDFGVAAVKNELLSVHPRQTA